MWRVGLNSRSFRFPVSPVQVGDANNTPAIREALNPVSIRTTDQKESGRPRLPYHTSHLSFPAHGLMPCPDCTILRILRFFSKISIRTREASSLIQEKNEKD